MSYILKEDYLVGLQDALSDSSNMKNYTDKAFPIDSEKLIKADNIFNGELSS